MSTVNVIMVLTRMGKFMYMQACLTNLIIICMHALDVTTLKHCHIVAMGMTLFQLPNSLSSAYLILEVLLIKHWRQSAFAETLLTVCRSRKASLYIYIYTIESVCLFVHGKRQNYGTD